MEANKGVVIDPNQGHTPWFWNGYSYIFNKIYVIIERLLVKGSRCLLTAIIRLQC